MAVPIAAIATGLMQVAPALAKWIGGDKAGKAAEKAVDLAKQVTGADSGEAALGELQTNSALALQYRQLVMQHEAEMTTAYMADTGDARDRDIEIQRLRGHNRRADFLAGMALLGLLGCITALFVVDIPEGDNRQLLLILLGSLSTLVTQVFAFEFGSSRGSKNKDADMASALKGLR